MLVRVLVVDPMEDGEHLDGARLDFEVVGCDDQKMYPRRGRIGARDVVFQESGPQSMLRDPFLVFCHIVIHLMG